MILYLRIVIEKKIIILLLKMNKTIYNIVNNLVISNKQFDLKSSNKQITYIPQLNNRSESFTVK